MARSRSTPQPPPGKNPFGQDHYELCNTMLQAHSQASEMYRRLALAGYNVQDLQMEIDGYAGIARGTKEQFFPHLP